MGPPSFVFFPTKTRHSSPLRRQLLLSTPLSPSRCAPPLCTRPLQKCEYFISSCLISAPRGPCFLHFPCLAVGKLHFILNVMQHLFRGAPASLSFWLRWICANHILLFHFRTSQPPCSLSPPSFAADSFRARSPTHPYLTLVFASYQ